MADLVSDVLLAGDPDEAEPELVDVANARGRMIDRLADIMLIAEEVRELAERAHVDTQDFLSIDQLMQHFYDKTNQLMHQFEN
jgi:hypothetical protein